MHDVRLRHIALLGKAICKQHLRASQVGMRTPLFCSPKFHGARQQLFCELKIIQVLCIAAEVFKALRAIRIVLPENLFTDLQSLGDFTVGEVLPPSDVGVGQTRAHGSLSSTPTPTDSRPWSCVPTQS